MELRSLNYFVRIAEIGSITRAAAHLHVARRISIPLVERDVSLDSVKLIGIFAWHVLAGSILFVVICFGAIGLNLFTTWMASIGMPTYITYAGSVLEYIVFTANVVCFIVFVVREAIVLIYRMIKL